jgi:hypothetical protein
MKDGLWATCSEQQRRHSSCETVDNPAGADFYERGMQALVHRWRKCIANGDDYVEK